MSAPSAAAGAGGGGRGRAPSDAESERATPQTGTEGLAAGRLAELAARDLALIERVRIVFEPGLNVLTGETGAGKSLVIDSLGLAIGMRADSSLVRHGAATARVEALFERLPEPLICVRELASSGRSTARIDDETVTAARLAETAGSLVEIHGQHEQQRLLDERVQRDLLDDFGGLGTERAAMAAAVDAWRANEAALAELALDPRELTRRLELQEHEAAEIRSAKLHAGEADEIRGRLAAAQHVEAIARGSDEIHELLAGEGTGGRDVAAQAAARATELARLDGRYSALADRLHGLAAELEDAAAEARTLSEDVEHDPATIAGLEERLSLIYSLERKYGDDEAAVLGYGERAAAEADRLRQLEASRAVREAERSALVEDCERAAGRLSERRQAAAGRLADAVSEALAALGFPAAMFRVGVSRRAAPPGQGQRFDSAGGDDVVYLIAPNPGEPARPLGKIASGGELSRVALAIKQVLARADRTPTLVFDEIDAGIGGRSAEPVGRSLWTLGRAHQVLCVTHLAQIAAYADAHFRIEKEQRAGRTVTQVRRLERDERIAELAQMLAGTEAGSAARASAAELLAKAEAWRDGRDAAAGA